MIRTHAVGLILLVSINHTGNEISDYNGKSGTVQLVPEHPQDMC
jgi:hypothetical protein